MGEQRRPRTHHLISPPAQVERNTNVGEGYVFCNTSLTRRRRQPILFALWCWLRMIFISLQSSTNTSFSENHTKRIEATFICLEEIQQDMSRRSRQHRTRARILHKNTRASQGTHAIIAYSNAVVNPPWSNSPVDVKWDG